MFWHLWKDAGIILWQVMKYYFQRSGFYQLHIRRTFYNTTLTLFTAMKIACDVMYTQFSSDISFQNVHFGL